MSNAFEMVGTDAVAIKGSANMDLRETDVGRFDAKLSHVMSKAANTSITFHIASRAIFVVALTWLCNKLSQGKDVDSSLSAILLPPCLCVIGISASLAGENEVDVIMTSEVEHEVKKAPVGREAEKSMETAETEDVVSGTNAHKRSRMLHQRSCGRL